MVAVLLYSARTEVKDVRAVRVAVLVERRGPVVATVADGVEHRITAVAGNGQKD